MKISAKTAVILLAVLLAFGLLAIALLIVPLYFDSAALPKGQWRRPRYNPWAVLAGIAGCVCVLVFIKSVLDWIEKRDREKAWQCPQCQGRINLAVDGSQKPCSMCAGTGKFGNARLSEKDS